jgi:prevent-host-death family protein
MSTVITVHEAKTTLSELLRRVEAGEDIVIARADKPIAILSAYKPTEVARTRRAGLGSLEGKLRIPSDDALLSVLNEEELTVAFGSSAKLFK